MDIQPQHTYDLGGAEDLVIWRYMTIEKFKDLLQTRSMYFRRMDRFIDEYEGHLNAHTKEVLDKMFVNEFSNHEEMAQSLKVALKHIKEITFVNCWHIADKESEEMWKEYASPTSGVVIKTTAKNLMASISETDLGVLHMKKVEYIDTIDQQVDLSHLLRILNTKQRKFNYENELRTILIYSKGDIDPTDGETVIMQTPESGLKINVDLNTLIQRVYIHPLASKTDYTLLRAIVMKLTGKWLRRSRLYHTSLPRQLANVYIDILRMFRKRN